ncbi:Uncharacterised protein [Listeria grayi]|uniref:Uncharacterized protein n=1 Tax=Listeria grayi TaxID=1641 RepID=A0A378PG02_LISGR|nr:Uncharacterised protein [Listeria grayi]
MLLTAFYLRFLTFRGDNLATKRLLFSDKLSNWRSLSFFIGKIVRIKNGKGDLLMLVNDAIYTYSAVINTVVHEGLTAYRKKIVTA